MEVNLNIDELMENKDDYGGLWHQDVVYRDYKAISKSTLRQLGIKDQSVVMVDNLEDLKKTPPNIIIAEARKNIKFVQNYVRQQELKKRQKYVMGLGVFQQLQFFQSEKSKLLKPASLQFKKFYKPYRGQDLSGKTLLVFRTGGIGDLLFIQPNLRYLKKKYPDCTIWFACGPQYQAMVEAWVGDCVDEILDLPYPIKYLTNSDYHAMFEGVIERCKQAHTDNAYNLFTHWLGLDLPDELLVPIQKAKPDKVKEVKEILDKWGVDKFFVMQLRASSPVRTPRPEFWANLITECVKRGHTVVLTDAARQSENIEIFRDTLDEDVKKKVFNFSDHSKTLDYTIALTQLSSLVVATDSALNHIAASLDVPCYGIYGPFPGYIRLKTYPKGEWVDAKRECVPCFLHGHKPCPHADSKGYSPCYDNINIKESVDQMEKLLS
jgi:ADP-heptose:LPS heptosyltransferase